MEIVEKAADDLIWQEEYEKARESHAIKGKVLADTTHKDGMLYHKGKIWLPRVVLTAVRTAAVRRGSLALRTTPHQIFSNFGRN